MSKTKSHKTMSSLTNMLFPREKRESSFCLISLKQKPNQCKVHSDVRKLENNSTDGRKTGTLAIAFSAVKLSHTTSLTQDLPTSYLSLIGGMTGSKLICSTLYI